MAKYNAQTIVVIFFQLIDRIRKQPAGGALEVAKFLKCDWGLGRSEGMRRFTFLVRAAIFRNCKNSRPLCPIEHCSAPEGEQRDRTNNHERNISSHRSPLIVV